MFTPGKSILADPSNDTPPINLAVVRVAAEPDSAPPVRVAVPSVILPPDTTPVNVPFTPETFPLNVPFVVVKLSVVVLALITTLF